MVVLVLMMQIQGDRPSMETVSARNEITQRTRMARFGARIVQVSGLNSSQIDYALSVACVRTGCPDDDDALYGSVRFGLVSLFARACRCFTLCPISFI